MALDGKNRRPKTFTRCHKSSPSNPQPIHTAAVQYGQRPEGRWDGLLHQEPGVAKEVHFTEARHSSDASTVAKPISFKEGSIGSTEEAIQIAQGSAI
jgi:hypothetical protein